MKKLSFLIILTCCFFASKPSQADYPLCNEGVVNTLRDFGDCNEESVDHCFLEATLQPRRRLTYFKECVNAILQNCSSFYAYILPLQACMAEASEAAQKTIENVSEQVKALSESRQRVINAISRD